MADNDDDSLDFEKFRAKVHEEKGSHEGWTVRVNKAILSHFRRVCDAHDVKYGATVEWLMRRFILEQDKAKKRKPGSNSPGGREL